jgi:hypothetical protein
MAIKDCPFCGSAGVKFTVSGSYGYYSSKTGHKCSNDKCPVKPEVQFDDEGYDWKLRKPTRIDSAKLSLDAWNTRA